MRFSIEQIFLTDSTGQPTLERRPSAVHHTVEAETLDDVLSSFLSMQRASLVGSIQRLPGAQAVATAQQRGTVFTFHVVPGSDTFGRRPRATALDAADARREEDRAP